LTELIKIESFRHAFVYSSGVPRILDIYLKASIILLGEQPVYVVALFTVRRFRFDLLRSECVRSITQIRPTARVHHPAQSSTSLSFPLYSSLLFAFLFCCAILVP
jgi:hypothetical protein